MTNKKSSATTTSRTTSRTTSATTSATTSPNTSANTSTTTTTTTTTVSELVIQHLVSFQQQLQKQQQSDDANVVVNRAIRNFQSKLEELALSNQLSGMSVDDVHVDAGTGSAGTGTGSVDGSDFTFTSTSRTISDQITTGLLTCIDCILLSFDGSSSVAIATSMSTSTVDDNITLLLDFIAGIAAATTSTTTTSTTSTNTRSILQELINQRVVVACAAALDRTRIFGCRLLCSIMIRAAASNDNTKNNDVLLSTNCIIDTLLPRMTDKAQSVRLAAIQAAAAAVACWNNHDHDHGHDNNATTTITTTAIQEALLWNLAHDPSVSNRCAALLSFNIITNTTSSTVEMMDHLIARLRDVKPKVRVAAVELLIHQEITSFTPHQCATIVRAGLTDRCKETSDATTLLLCTRWIKQAKYDPVFLLTHLNPSIYEQECETVIKTLLKVASDASSAFIKDLSDAEIGAFRQGMNNTNILLSVKNDTAASWKPETLLVARLQCDQAKLSPAKKADLLSKIVPDIPVLCDAIQNSLDTLANLAVSAAAVLVESDDADNDNTNNQEQQEEAQIFICNQLFKLAQLMDLQEEGSRRHFLTACKAMLTSIHTPEELLEEAIKAMSRAHDREDDYLSSISDIIDQMGLVVGDHHDAGDETQRMIQLRVVSILTIVLENTSPRMALHPALKNFVHHVVPAVTNDDALIREAGVGCLGRLALLSEESTVLAEFKPLFFKVVTKEEETMEIRAQAMLALCDLTMLFDNILVPIDVGDSDISFVNVVSTMLQNENPSVVAVASEVAAKLLFSGKVEDKDLLASLLVVFFNKTYDDYDEDEAEDVQEVGSVFRMQQLLSLFFQAYSMKSQDCKSTLVRAIRPMLESVATKSKKKRNGGTWPISKMIEFVYATAEIGTEEEGTDNENQEGKEVPSSSTSTALLVCIEISSFLVQHNDNLTNTNLRTLCKLLGGADVDLEATADGTRCNLLELKEKVNELGMLITDEASLESLETMMELLEEMDEEKDSNEEDDLVDGMEHVALLDKENDTSFVSAGKEPVVAERRSALAAVN